MISLCRCWLMLFLNILKYMHIIWQDFWLQHQKRNRKRKSIFDETAHKKQNLKLELEETNELVIKFDGDKQQREVDKFKDYKMKFSPLTSTKSIPLYTDDWGEYWNYLTITFGAEENRYWLFIFLLICLKTLKIT